MKLEYLDIRMPDGSRLFTKLPGSLSWREIKEHLQSLQDLTILRFDTDGVTEGWLDFRYFGQEFTIHDPLDEFYVFANDGRCSSLILNFLMEHLRRMESA